MNAVISLRLGESCYSSLMTSGKILFHNNQISERGEATNLVASSQFLEKFFYLKSIFAAPERGQNNQAQISELRQMGHEVFLYKTLDELQKYSAREQVSHAVWMNDGRYSNLWIPDARNVVHAVFNNFEPYGDQYAYVSKWLYTAATKNKRGRLPAEVEALRLATSSPYKIDRTLDVNWVPHTVQIKFGDGQRFRERLKIPKDSQVVGRIGAFTEFNDSEAQKAIIELLSRENYFFVFVNTFPFVIHKNIRYLGYISTEEKWDFYAACDVFLNGRLMGESFGYTVTEPLMLGKPVIAPHKVRNRNMDCHHIEILKSQKLLYRNSSHLMNLIKQQIDNPISPELARSLVVDFSEEKVAERFYDVFISE